jgi:hypothetical protein
MFSTKVSSISAIPRTEQLLLINVFNYKILRHSLQNKTIYVTSGTATDYPSGAPEFTSVVFSYFFLFWPYYSLSLFYLRLLVPPGVSRHSIVYKNRLSERCVAPLVHATIILIIKWPFLKTWVNPKVLGGVRVAHLFSRQFCVLDCLFLFCFVCLVCSMLPLSLDCSFLIAPSVFSNIY